MGDFLDFLDKFCHTGLIYKLKICGVSGNILYLIKSYLKNRSHEQPLIIVA